MKLVFLGTASCFPTPSRGVSCAAIKWDDGDVWIFDCGEGSQIQIQKSPLKPGRVTKIFITHLHGDHLFGLPGFLCTLGNGGNVENKHIHVYGPLGVKAYVNTCLELSSSPLPFKCTFHEMVPKDDQFSNDVYQAKIKSLLNDRAENSGDEEGDEIIHFDATSKSWRLVFGEKEDACVSAAAIKHRIPSFGFLVTEKDKPGRLDVGKLQKMGLKPGPSYAELKKGKEVTLPDGSVVRPKDVLGAPKKGRKVVVLGDTCDTREIEELCEDADLVVHEATMENALEDKAIEYGHSTPRMAAAFAVKTKAKKLCLTHVSPRYKPISTDEAKLDEEGDKSAKILLDEAQQFINESASHCEVTVAEDFFELPL